ncbi:hypothetical protein ACP4OV_008453 [Aristida adscensionis]
MAEQIMNYVTIVVAAGELAGKAFSGLAGNLGKEPELDEKLERLEMMLLKIHSAVEASQNHTIENTSLLHWRVKLKKAAAEGELVLASFRQRAMVANHQQDGNASSSITTVAAPANQPQNGGASFSNTTAVALANEQQDGGASSSNITAVAPANEQQDGGGAPSSSNTIVVAPPNQQQDDGGAPSSNTTTAAPANQEQNGSSAPSSNTTAIAPANHEQDGGTALSFTRNALSAMAKGFRSAAKMMSFWSDEDTKKLDAALEKLENYSSDTKEFVACFCMRKPAVKLADRRNLSGHEWLACWADTLREAKAQGTATIAAISAAGEEIVGCDVQKSVELQIFMHSMESLAGSMDFFHSLLRLCPSYH